MGIQYVHMYHFVLFICISIMMIFQQHTPSSIACWIGYLIVCSIFVIKLRNKTRLFSIREMRLYLPIQWLIIFVIAGTNLSMTINIVLAIILLLLYIFMVSMTSTMQKYQASLASVQQDMKRLDDTFLSIRAQRHDFLKHINTLHYLLDERHIQKATEYMNDLVDDYDVVNTSIKGEAAYMASILFQYAKRARDEHVTLSYQLNIAVSKLPLQPIDQVNLIANLLENALDAAAHSSMKEKKVTLETSIYGGIYRISIVNTTNPIPHEILDHLFTQFNKTTKGGEHQGLGTYIIKDIISRYNGQLDYTYEVNKMTINITLPNIKGKKKLVS